MSTLKDIDGVSAVLGKTPLAQSSLWNAPVEGVSRFQLVAFRERLALEGKRDQADAIIDYLLQRIAKVAPDAPALMYQEPRRFPVLTSEELLNGLNELPAQFRAALLFALEARMPVAEVVSLTWPEAKKLARRGKLSMFAVHILKSQPVSLNGYFVFWHYKGQRLQPLFGLEAETFDVFGKSWSELQRGYDKLVIVDYD